MSDKAPTAVQPPTDKQPVIDIQTGCWTQYGQRQQWDMWLRTGGFTDGVWEALLAGLVGSTQFNALLNQFNDMQIELAELRTELASRQSYDDQIEDLRIQIAAQQQFNDNVIQQQEVAKQEAEIRESVQFARQMTDVSSAYAYRYGTDQDLGGTNTRITNLTTDNIAEASNLYFTTARARTSISATGSLSYNSGTGVISYTTPANSATATALATPRNIAITGDLAWNVSFDGSTNVTAAGTLATVNSNVGSFGSASSVPSFTVNAKGLITAASATAVIADAGTLTGTTLNSSVTTSSLTQLGVSYTATPGVITGYIIINDSGGTPRKVAVTT